MESFYDILGVSIDADEQQIKLAYRAKAKQYHPDRNKGHQAEERFKQINEAYRVLSNKNLRSYYDAGFASLVQQYTQQPSPTPEHKGRYQPGDYSHLFAEERRKQKEADRFTPKKIVLFIAGYGLLAAVLLFFGGVMDSFTAQKHYEEASLIIKGGDYMKGYTLLKQALEKDEEHADANWLIGQVIMEKLHRPDRALVYFRRARAFADDDNDSLRYILGYAQAAEASSNFNEAVTAYQQYLDIGNTNDGEILSSMAKINVYELGKGSEAEVIYRKLIDMDSLSAEVYTGLGVALQQQAKYEDSYQYLIQAAALQQVYPINDYYLGMHMLRYEHDTLRACNYWFRAAQSGFKKAEDTISTYCQ
ncbi:DnaJ domain-containing protein [Limibacter armeniacum]|uniref:DnaJ domain-containing protein n=1 Tax=Limibacter armeniacum TaxID=466084 RepID=UPI002FE5BE0B